jgi:hypothetical protein
LSEFREERKEAWSKRLGELRVDRVIMLEETLFAMLAVVAKQGKVSKLCRRYFGLMRVANLEVLEVRGVVEWNKSLACPRRRDTSKVLSARTHSGVGADDGGDGRRGGVRRELIKLKKLACLHT